MAKKKAKTFTQEDLNRVANRNHTSGTWCGVLLSGGILAVGLMLYCIGTAIYNEHIEEYLAPKVGDVVVIVDKTSLLEGCLARVNAHWNYIKESHVTFLTCPNDSKLDIKDNAYSLNRLTFYDEDLKVLKTK